MSVLGSAAALLALRIAVEGSCPAVAKVEAKVAAALGDLVDESDATAQLEPLDDRLRVEVRSGSGALLVVHDLALGPSCDDLAAAAAVVIATAVGSAPQTGALPSVVPVPIPMPVIRRSPPVPVRPSVPVALDVGASVGVEFALPRPGGGGFLWLSVGPSPQQHRTWSRLGLILRLGGTSLKQVSLTQGLSDWTRLDLALGPRLRLAAGLWQCDLFLVVSPALVLVSGRELPQTFSSTGFDLGLGGGAKLGARLQALFPFVALSATGYVIEQSLRVQGLSDTTRLPPYSVQISLGLSWHPLP
ncbi:MAG: hypothetical protein JNM40_10960 [Myxococcales bacterium]|nr:hypothetical protein [Myxococcales bacterium]